MIKKIAKMMPITLILLTTFGCDFMADQVVRYPMGLGSYNDIRYYTFDPETVLASIDQDKTDLFQPMPTHAEHNLFSSGSFSWYQQDYLKIVSALNQFVGKDSLENWKYYSMTFDTVCSDNFVGFDDAQITYFQNNGEEYTTRELDIYPLSREADWGGDAYFPRPSFGWKSIDLDRLKFTAEDALQIAEKNGGQEARLAAKNDCIIFVMIAPNTAYDSWNVLYYNSSSHVFQMIVDPYSGGYRIISSK